jgi:Mg2+ and Co2+ transporter CorA
MSRGPEPDGMDARDLLKDLRSIKLTRRDKEFVALCTTVWKKTSVLPPETMKQLRSIFRSNRRKLAELYESQERARASMAREQNAAAMAEIDAIDQDDFGF